MRPAREASRWWGAMLAIVLGTACVGCATGTGQRDEDAPQPTAAEINALVAALDQKPPMWVRDPTVEALVEMGRPAVGALIKALKDTRPQVRAKAAVALGGIGDRRAVDPLVDALADEDVAGEAAAALGEIGDPRAVGPLVDALADEDVAGEAAAALGEIGDCRAVGPLLAMVLDTREDRQNLRWDAGNALARISAGEAIGPLVDALGSNDADLRGWAARVLEDYLRAADGFDRLPKRARNYRDLRNWGESFGPHLPSVECDLKQLEAQRIAHAAAVQEALTATFREALSEPGNARSIALLFGAMPFWTRYDWGRVEARETGPPAIGPLIDALADEDAAVRAGAAAALGKIGDRRATDPLIALLHDAQEVVRLRAARALGELKDPAALSPLIALLETDRNEPPEGYPDCDEDRAQAAWALGRLKDPRAVDALVAALKVPDDSVMSCAAEALGDIADPRAIQPLVEIASGMFSLSEFAGVAAHRALVQIGEPAVGPLIAALRRNPDGGWTAMALSKIGEPAIEPLVTLLAGDNEDLCLSAAHSLGSIQSPSLVPRLAEALRNADARVRRWAASALGRAADKWATDRPPNGQAVEPLIGALGDPDKEVRTEAIRALADSEDRRAVMPLIRVMENDKDEDVANEAVIALHRIPDPRAIGPLRKVLLEGTPECMALNAGVALGAIDDPRVPGMLIGCLERSADPTRRAAAARGLAEVRDARARRPLLAALKDADAWVRSSAAGALGERRDRAALAALAEVAAKDPDEEVRKAAAEAIAEIREPPAH